MKYELVYLFILFLYVLDVMGDHMVEAYLGMGLDMVLYVQSIVSLCMHHLVDKKTLRMGSVLDALDAVLFMCLLYVSLWSRVRHTLYAFCSRLL